ncbi:hypothetical protein ACFWM0_28895 [Streptomyces sp. NPDC058405]|uniref:hypothetical protein n=1 Tax=Streptomyces sp. NPDC058405 TaxID=3346482 RepID=UPI00364FD622
MSPTATAEKSAGRAAVRLVALATSTLFLSTGCSTMNNGGLDYEPQRMSVSDAKDLVRDRSSALFAVSGLPEASNGAPDASACAGVDHGFLVRHFWSMYSPSSDDLKQAMDRLHTELPAKGWKVVRFEPAKSQAKQLQLDVEHEKDHHTATIELLLRSTYKNPSKWDKNPRDKLSVSLTSPCYVDPEYKVGD